MAVSITFTNNEFKDILSNFNIGDFISAEPLTKGTVQTNYFLRTSSGRYIFKFYNNREPESVLCEAEIVNYLTNKAFPCPKIVPNQDGENVIPYRKRSFVIYEFIDGTHVDKLNGNQWGSVIKAIAELHKKSRGFIPEHVESRMNYSPELCIKLAEDKVKQLKTIDAERKLAWIKNTSVSLDLPETLPKEISHGDLEASNILFQGDEIIALIDFDDANYTYSTFDLVVLIEHSAWKYGEDDTLDWTRARDVIERYWK